jgi:hypothetical protein
MIHFRNSLANQPAQKSAKALRRNEVRSHAGRSDSLDSRDPRPIGCHNHMAESNIAGRFTPALAGGNG